MISSISATEGTRPHFPGPKYLNEPVARLKEFLADEEQRLQAKYGLHSTERIGTNEAFAIMSDTYLTFVYQTQLVPYAHVRDDNILLGTTIPTKACEEIRHDQGENIEDTIKRYLQASGGRDVLIHLSPTAPMAHASENNLYSAAPNPSNRDSLLAAWKAQVPNLLAHLRTPQSSLYALHVPEGTWAAHWVPESMVLAKTSAGVVCANGRRTVDAVFHPYR